LLVVNPPPLWLDVNCCPSACLSWSTSSQAPTFVVDPQLREPPAAVYTMAAGRPIFAFLSLFFTGGACLLIFLVLLAGATNHNPVDRIYFLQAATAKIPGAPAQSRWTFWNLCPVRPDGTSDCGKVHPAFPFDPPSHRNFDTHVGVPPAFIGTSTYFYLTRFMFAFVLIGLFFSVMSLFTGLLALCSRIGGYLSGLLNMIGLFFQLLTATLMTAAYVLGRDKFRHNGQKADIGTKAFAFMWAAFVCLLISTVLYCLAGASGRQRSTTTTTTSKRRGLPFFKSKRSRSTRSARSGRSRGSFLDGNSKEFV